MRERSSQITQEPRKKFRQTRQAALHGCLPAEPPRLVRGICRDRALYPELGEGSPASSLLRADDTQADRHAFTLRCLLVATGNKPVARGALLRVSATCLFPKKPVATVQPPVTCSLQAAGALDQGVFPPAANLPVGKGFVVAGLFRLRLLAEAQTRPKPHPSLGTISSAPYYIALSRPKTHRVFVSSAACSHPSGFARRQDA